MRSPAVFLCLLGLLAGCASSATTSGGIPAGGALVADVLPLDAAVSRYATKPPGALVLRTEPSADGASAIIWMDGDVPAGRRLEVSRAGTAITLGAGPGSGYELVRVGARAGESWESGGRTVHFEGWERVETPAGIFDAARIRTVRREGNVVDTEVWWLASGEGIVRYASDKGGLFTLEMTRVN